MAAHSQLPRIIRFGPYEADLQNGELRKHGLRLKLQGQPFQILIMLLERPGQIVTREEVQKALWSSDTFVDFDHSLGSAINKLRQALGDSAEAPRYIETIPRRGFRFVGAIAAPAVAAQPTSSSSRWVWIATLAAAVLAIAGYFMWRSSAIRAPAQNIMLAVLPFENLSGNPEQDYFSDGLTAEVITQLGGLEPTRLGVIARNSVMRYKHTDKSAAQIGRELGVDYLLEGTVRREGDHARITVQLVQVRNQTYVWAHSYERDLGSMIAFHSEVGRDVARQVRVQLTPESQARLAGTAPVNPDAYEAYLKGLYLWNKMTVDGFYKSVQHFQEAIDKDPHYAPAYSGLAAAYAGMVEFGQMTPSDAYPKSAAAARKALAIDQASSQAHTALQWSLVYYDHDWAAAEREFRRALELNPSNAEARSHYAKFLAALGRFDEALEQIERARQLDPVSPLIGVTAAQIAFWQRHYDAALAQLAKLREMDPNFPPMYWTLAHVYEATGKNAEASEAILKTWDLASGHADGIAQLENLRVRAGWRVMWEQIVKSWLNDASRGVYQQPYQFVDAYLLLGRNSEMLQELGKAVEAHDNEVVFINVDPRFDQLRADPRFHAVVAALKFPK
jgi:TolB-like protein/DNA-binding winged helix-turn-helix (wHTH) protein/lipoprotein NlpI